jgi:hypothetical protein
MLLQQDSVFLLILVDARLQKIATPIVCRYLHLSLHKDEIPFNHEEGLSQG